MNKTNKKNNENINVNSKKQNKKNTEILIYFLYALIIIFIVSYIITQNTLFGFAAFASIVITLFFEFRSSIKSEGAKNTIRDLIIAIILVIIVFWVIPTIYLQSSSPINVVASCSMLPNIQRGNLVFVHGISNITQFLKQNNIPVINVSKKEFSQIIDNLSEQFIEPLPYIKNKTSEVLFNDYYPKNSSYSIALYNIACIDNYFSKGLRNLIGSCIINSSTTSNPIKYIYSTENLSYQNNIYTEPYISGFRLNNITVYENYSNPIIVYKTIPGDSFTDSQIVHRVFAALEVNNTYYILTKGDNNPILDMQDMNYPPNQSDVIGYVVLNIPYLGYPSLILKGQFGTVQGCNETLTR
ncbi:MAG: hypothetical protein QXD23_00980 [Candidatus Micrarchaeaceae archaeon]